MDGSALPTVEAVTTGSLAPADGGADNPEHKEDDGRDPQQMRCKPCTEKNQYQEKKQYEQHARRVPAATMS
jgi:hypothetical protein